jgi:hypothetical protein
VIAPKPPHAECSREAETETRIVKLVHEGDVIRRIPLDAVDQLIARGWAEWRGHGSRRRLELTVKAPVSSLLPTCPLTGDGTRPMRAAGMARPDGTASPYSPGQRLGGTKYTREHRLAR